MGINLSVIERISDSLGYRLAKQIKKFVACHNFAVAFTPHHHACNHYGNSDTVDEGLKGDRISDSERTAA